MTRNEGLNPPLRHFLLECREQGERLCSHWYCVCLNSPSAFDWDESLCTCLWGNVCFGVALLLLVGCGMQVSLLNGSQEKFSGRKKKREQKDRKIYDGWPRKSRTFVFYPWNQIRRIALKDSIGTQLSLHLLHHPVLPFSRIIFSFTGKEHVWSPLLLETRLASEVPPSRPFSPPSLSVCLAPLPHGLRHGTGKAKRRLKGSDAGHGAKVGLGSSIWRGLIMFRDWLSATTPLSSLISKTGHHLH